MEIYILTSQKVRTPSDQAGGQDLLNVKTAPSLQMFPYKPNSLRAMP